MTRHTPRAACRAFVLLLVATAPAAALDPTPQAAVVTPLASTDKTDAGQPLVLPRDKPRVIASIFEIPPGATLPVHKHPSARYAYVLAGKLRVTNADTGQTTDYETGDFIVEMIDQWHQGSNIGLDPVKLLVIDQIEAGSKATVLRQ